MQNTPDRAVADQIEEKQRTFVSRDAHEALIDQMAGVVLKKLSGWSARIAGQDLCQRREAEAVLREMRTELAKVRQEMAGKRGEPPLDAGRLVCVTAHCVAEVQQPIRKTKLHSPSPQLRQSGRRLCFVAPVAPWNFAPRVSVMPGAEATRF
jgi:hypothetical protein